MEGKKYWKIICLLGIAFLVLGLVSTGFSAGENMNEKGKITQMKYTAHAAVHITSNTDFTTVGATGSGTKDDPYLIEGWEIDAKGGSYGIWIENTDAYFVIKNCKVVNATDTDNPPYSTGIALNNVEHGTITSNNVSGNTYNGLRLESSNNNTIDGNNITNNGKGIYLVSSSNNTISRNNITGNTNGIDIDSLNYNNTIVSNKVVSNTYAGILLGASSNNTIRENNASDNGEYGIQLYGSTNNTITGNNASGNFEAGVYVSHSNYNNISDNKVFQNTHYGLYLYDATNNTFRGNNASYNSLFGIYMIHSSNNSITYSDLYYNVRYGVNITGGSTDNILVHNNFIGNNGAAKGTTDGKSQAYDDSSGNVWYNETLKEGNYWSNWDGNGWGTSNAYPIDGGGGAYDKYPLAQQVSEFSAIPLITFVLISLLILSQKKMRNL